MPPARYRIVERDGRLEVIDGETGERPLSAAERMAAHDAAHGHAALRYDRLEAERAPAPPPVAPAPTDPIRARLGEKASPWQASGEARPPRAKRAKDAPSAAASQPAKGTFVTGKWWDSKGPRTVTLGAKGRKKLTETLLAWGIASFFTMIVLMIAIPVLPFVIGFVLFRYGSAIIAPLGARTIDAAIAADR